LILLERQQPTTITYYEALIRRTSPFEANITDYLERLRRLRAGYKGELLVDREWLEATISCQYYLLHSFEFTNSAGFTHQIDTLLLTPHCALIVEIKNIAGQIQWDETTHQFTRITKNGIIEGFRNPFNQAERHTRHLHYLFQKLKLHLPIHYVVILANPNSIIITKQPTLPMIHATGIHKYLEQLLEKYPATLNEQELKRAATKIKKYHSPSPLLKEIKPIQLIKGVLCPQCAGQIRMHYYQGKWHCPQCKTTNNDAFYQALQDYRLLVSPTISNKEFRAFFGVANTHNAYLLLKNLNLPYVGSYKDRRYIIPAEIKLPK